ncbi:TetR/AcrR family transcriptional regulator [Nocardia thailandica]|uniref:TetR/AcrR family transcriptional regulator n=1 Tax=Nocardia thailandica TaxID=257275 RepID=UPI0002F4FFC6|nr:TetR/AcrR family transcriptional regulator [Nocardia thailandica]
MTPRTDTRQRFLDAAADLFHTQGYHATGLNQLVSAGGAPKGSFYFHFPGGKEQLAAEALAQSGEQLRELLAAALDTAGFDGLFEALGAVLADSGYTRGCPIATIALDAGGESDAIRAACAGGFESWRGAIGDHLRAEGIPAGRADHLATVALALIEGGLLLARTQRDLAPLRTVATHLRTLLESELS